MVREANVKQAMAEKQLKEALGKVIYVCFYLFLFCCIFFLFSFCLNAKTFSCCSFFLFLHLPWSSSSSSSSSSSDRCSPGRGPSPENSCPFLPDVTCGRAAPCWWRCEDAIQKGPQQEQKHVLCHNGDAARPDRHTAHCARV